MHRPAWLSTLGRRWKTSLGLAVAALVISRLAFDAIAVRATFVSFRPAAAARGEPVAAGAPKHRLQGRVYLEGAASASSPLVVVLHGDAPFIHPGYQYAFASRLAVAVPGTRVVGLIRPGYADAYGARSDGDRGLSTGDTYSPGVTQDVADAIRALKSQWAAPSLVLVGHSGGAAVAANVAATTRGLVQEVIPVSCPCDVPAFRLHMARTQMGPFWLLPVGSSSPLVTIEEMDPTTIVTAISGEDDPVALPEYSRSYVAQARARGIAAMLIMLPHEGHEVLLDDAVIEAVAHAVRSLRAGTSP